ncbi:hypothetical protein CupriaWKF_05235 [Cupriavidus sp. WKF15]|uniref:hypothetical protein n=1 Tax=Cupriavidus sp. WKF15 TaxID=3032282 RepID=UPI0023E33A2F|nr:hypothetical protein [Cupriavidus sp. WKF15]WER46980.1 hypothetical protein CupriaWKF_05235 [Cupriavidus sp. WKF15]
MSRTSRTAGLTLFLCFFLVSPVTRADSTEYKEKFRDGPCKVERKQKGDGEYKEKRKCKGGPPGYEQKQKYREGPCLIEREWKDNGDYEEKVECKRS